MTTLSTAAWVSHDMALAAGLGGALFKQVTFPSALSKVSDDKQRAHLLARGYKKFAPIGLSSLGIIAGTWLVGRSMIGGRSISASTRNMVYVKDALIGGALLTGLAGTYLDYVLEDEADHGEIAVHGMSATDASTPKAKNVFNAIKGIGIAHTLCLAGALGLTTVLAMQSSRSMKWSFLSRILP